MIPLAPSRRRWLVVILFAVAMAWVEAASVSYIRVVVDRIVPYQQIHCRSVACWARSSSCGKRRRSSCC